MQIKKAVSILKEAVAFSLLLATYVVVLLVIGGSTGMMRQDPNREREQFHFVVKAVGEWDLHATKVCMFFGSGLSTAPVNTVGCCDQEDEFVFNRDDKPYDHLYSVDIDAPKTTQVRLGQGHNARLYCERADGTRLVCYRVGLWR